MARPGKPYPAFSLPREQDHFWGWRTRSQRRGGKGKKKKKLKWLTAHGLSSKGFLQNDIRVVEEPVSSIQPSIVNTLVSFAITRTDPSDHGKKKRKKERTRAERVNRDLLPGCQWCWQSSGQWSLSHSTNQVCTINLSGMTLMDIWSNDVCPSHSTQPRLPARESLTETRHMHTHTQSREAGVWMQYTNIITLLCLLWRTMAAGSWHSNAQGKPFPG